MKITKKKIQTVLHSQDRTEIYKIVAQVLGKKPKEFDVYRFIKEHARTNKVYDSAYSIAYKKPHRYGLDFERAMDGCSFDFSRENRISNVIHYAIKNASEPETSYTKVPMWANGEIVFASKIYGMDDYNLWYTGINDERLFRLLTAYVKNHIKF